MKRLLCMALLLLAMTPAMRAEDFSAKEVVLEHIKDSHEWHVTDLGEGKSLVIPLPVIVNSSTGWHVFSSSQFEHHADANGLRQGPYGLAIATEGENADKIVENGEPVLDLSITKTVAVMFINVAILLCCILGSARWYKKRQASDPASTSLSCCAASWAVPAGIRSVRLPTRLQVASWASSRCW